MESVKGYKDLSPGMQELFNSIRHLHVSRMGEAEKEKHSDENLVSVKVNQEEHCFEVHYKHDWYKYYSNGTWG